MIKKYLKIALLGVALLCQGSIALAQTGTRNASLPAPPSSPLYKNVLYVSQSTELGQASASPPSVRFGPLTVSSVGYGVRTNFTDVSRSSGVSGMDRIPFSGTQTTESALSIARAWSRTGLATNYRNSIATYMRARGISIAYFSYYQAVNISAGAAGVRKKGIMWSGTVDLNGRALYGDPRLVDGDPVFVDVQYFPLRPGEGVLAEDLNKDIELTGLYTELAGKIRWRLLNKNLNPMPMSGANNGGYAVIDTGGAYDETSGVEGESGAVACFIDKRHPNCNRSISTTDAANIATSQGASGVFAYYAQGVKLEYEEQGGDQLPVVSLSYDKREISCTALTQTIAIGKNISLNGALYYGAFNGTFFEFSVVDHFTRKLTIDPKSYLRSATLDYVAAFKYDPLKTLVSPFPDPGVRQLYTLDNMTEPDAVDFLNKVSYVSVVTDKRKPAKYVGLLDDAVKSTSNSYIMKIAQSGGSTGGSTGGGGGGGGSTQQPDMQQQGVSTSVSPMVIIADPGEGGGGGGTTTPAPTTIDYEIGLGNTSSAGPDNNLVGGSGSFFTGTFYFNVKDASTVETFLLTFLGWDDHMQVLINGQQIIHTDGGDMLAVATSPAGSQCAGNYVTVPVMQCFNYAMGGEDDGKCTDERQVGTTQVWRANPYADLMTQVSSSAWTDVRETDDCSWRDYCPKYNVLYASSGCVMNEIARDNRQSAGMDLRPYLVNGMNSITINVTVGDHGEAWLRLRSSASPAGCVDN